MSIIIHVFYQLVFVIPGLDVQTARNNSGLSGRPRPSTAILKVGGLMKTEKRNWMKVTYRLEESKHSLKIL